MEQVMQRSYAQLANLFKVAMADRPQQSMCSWLCQLFIKGQTSVAEAVRLGSEAVRGVSGAA